jgi:hypothetical protein
MAVSQDLHPTAALLLPSEERVKDDMSYFRKLGVKYEADALIDPLKREKPKSAMPVGAGGGEISRTRRDPVAR